MRENLSAMRHTSGRNIVCDQYDVVSRRLHRRPTSTRATLTLRAFKTPCHVRRASSSFCVLKHDIVNVTPPWELFRLGGLSFAGGSLSFFTRNWLVDLILTNLLPGSYNRSWVATTFGAVYPLCWVDKLAGCFTLYKSMVALWVLGVGSGRSDLINVIAIFSPQVEKERTCLPSIKKKL